MAQDLDGSANDDLAKLGQVGQLRSGVSQDWNSTNTFYTDTGFRDGATFNNGGTLELTTDVTLRLGVGSVDEISDVFSFLTNLPTGGGDANINPTYGAIPINGGDVFIDSDIRQVNDADNILDGDLSASETDIEFTSTGLNSDFGTLATSATPAQGQAAMAFSYTGVNSGNLLRVGNSLTGSGIRPLVIQITGGTGLDDDFFTNLQATGSSLLIVFTSNNSAPTTANYDGHILVRGFSIQLIINTQLLKKSQ